MGLIDKIEYVNKAEVLKIVGEDSEQAAAIDKLMVFKLPERNGQWLLKPQSDSPALFECSICGYHNIVTPYFCECCGARMNTPKGGFDQ